MALPHQRCAISNRDRAEAPPALNESDQLLAKFGVRADCLGAGVSRLDYTQGIVERFRGLECILEKQPADLIFEMSYPRRD
jgi:trehalose-6-phosphate synthase